MHLDVQDLRNFYYREPLGRAAQRALRNKVLQFWPNLSGQTIAGFGFATPLLRPFLPQARRVIALMPGPQGVLAWPNPSQNVSVLTDERFWPLETGHVDRLIVLHGLETSEDANTLLQEAYRVLGPGGRALFIVPNRAGLWSRSDKTPMGFGRPYSTSQLETQLRLHGFLPQKASAALFQIPSNRRSWQKMGPFLERIGNRLPRLAGGVLMLEVSTRTPPLPGLKTPVLRARPLRVLEGLRAADPKPALERAKERC
ncbi:MAG: methyltransferase domain-containing protein [Rhodobacteraceae bacterium]|nr:methyltransferase domain-containing protein [Paracoccaceae bacterium]